VLESSLGTRRVKLVKALRVALLVEEAVEIPSFEELSEALTRAAAQIGSAESHGLLCGMLCARAPFDEGEWLGRVLDDVDSKDPLVEACRGVLRRLAGATMRQLQSVDCTFEILLPPDNEALALRSQSLGDWCTGFLAGVGLGGRVYSQLLPGDSREVLQDIAEITRIDVATCADEEGNETAYAELVEYLRVGTLIIQEELQTLK
jgi:yecA family protein